MLLVVGGIVPQPVLDELNAMGVRGVFGPGASLADITSFIRSKVKLDRVY